MNPIVSIIVPCYNQAQYLDECLQTVLLQSYQYWECIIVNDGSPDNTESVAKVWTEKDTRFKYLYKENGGLSSARNAGIQLACGEFILPLDADDMIGVEYCSKALEIYIVNPDLKVVYCQAEKFGEETGKWHLPHYSTVDLVNYNMIFCSAIFRKKEWLNVGGYDTNMVYGLEDWEFWIAILKGEGEVHCLDYIGFYYRIKEVSMTRDLTVDQIAFSENYIRTKHIDTVMNNFHELQRGNQTLHTRIQKLETNFKSEKVLIKALFAQLFSFFRIKKQQYKSN